MQGLTDIGAHWVGDLRGGSELVPTPTARKLSEMVAAYNPEREGVVCLTNPAWEQWAALQLSNPLLPPPVAHRWGGRWRSGEGTPFHLLSVDNNPRAI